MIIVGGTSNRSLSEHLAAESGSDIASVEIRNFPDGEKYVRILSSLAKKDVVIVSATYPDSNIIETLLLHDAASRAQPNTIRLLIPYYGYQRQDKLFREGESISAEVIAGILDGRFDEIMTVDLHAEGVSRYFHRTKVRNFVASALVARYFRKKRIDTVISPDGGSRAVEYAKIAANELGCEYDYFLKERIDSST
ncbi:MAG: ribose-phosphate diphosphokinase, partial [Candidatus Thermoplasmatota archaeon]|nr:ribose-phosphate diphosphokinase [Candidatus Thermoplasmatota archaeon]